jgi:hypothetical protein
MPMGEKTSLVGKNTSTDRPAVHPGSKSRSENAPELEDNISSSSTWNCTGKLTHHREAGVVWAHSYQGTKNKAWVQPIESRNIVAFGRLTGVAYKHLHIMFPKSQRYSVIYTDGNEVRIAPSNKLTPIDGSSCSDARWKKVKEACDPAFTQYLDTKVPRVFLSHFVPSVAHLPHLMQSKHHQSVPEHSNLS